MDRHQVKINFSGKKALSLRMVYDRNVVSYLAPSLLAPLVFSRFTFNFLRCGFCTLSYNLNYFFREVRFLELFIIIVAMFLHLFKMGLLSHLSFKPVILRSVSKGNSFQHPISISIFKLLRFGASLWPLSIEGRVY